MFYPKVPFTTNEPSAHAEMFAPHAPTFKDFSGFKTKISNNVRNKPCKHLFAASLN